MTRFITTTWLLMARALREARRQPANDLGNAFIPLFFYLIAGASEKKSAAGGKD